MIDTFNGGLTLSPTDNFKEKYNLSESEVTISASDASKYEGVYFILAGEGGNVFNLEAATGDWIISNGSSWGKIDNTDAVASVAGLTGTITATALAKKLAETNDANELALKSEVDAVEVTASGDNTLLTASVSDKRAISVAPTVKLTEAVAKADTAYQKPIAGIPRADLAGDVQNLLGMAGSSLQAIVPGNYYLGVSAKDGNSITLTPKVTNVADATAQNNGLASSNDVKTYVDAQWEWEEL